MLVIAKYSASLESNASHISLYRMLAFSYFEHPSYLKKVEEVPQYPNSALVEIDFIHYMLVRATYVQNLTLFFPIIS